MAAGLNLITRDAVDAALREFARLGRETFLAQYGFGKALDYFVRDPLTGGWADSKAIVGAAYGFRFPERGPLRSTDFSGGQVQVVKLLRELRFEIASPEEVQAALSNGERSWSKAEVELVVADYLDMLALELAGQKFNKAERRRNLLVLLNGRTESSIEFKRRNISAALLELGYPYLRGYLPASNFQAALLDVLDSQLSNNDAIARLAATFSEVPAVPVEVPDMEGVRVNAPARREQAVREPGTWERRASKRDYLEREARNRSLGAAGELFILQYERWRLSVAGVGQLADKVRHVSVEDGDGTGYDILSFDEDGSERFVEVKTTSLGELTPFFVSANEVRFAREAGERYFLCRLFDFRASPRFFELRGTIESHCQLDPTTYRATLH